MNSALARAAYVAPRATYRLQLNAQFKLEHARAILPYLQQLGISHLYLSPLLKARPGSLHGYDVTDHSKLNAEIGTLEEFEAFSHEARAHDLGIIVDIVPNHMAVMADDNLWWLDVLENGPAAEHAPFFDIDWFPIRAAMAQRLLVPVLGKQYGYALEDGELKVEFDAEQGAFSVRYYEHCFPIDPHQYPQVFAATQQSIASIPGADDADLQDFASLLEECARLPPSADNSEAARSRRYRGKEVNKRRLARLCLRSTAIKDFIEQAVHVLNGEQGNPRSFDPLDTLLRAQPYRLSYWRVAGDEINYRRFFDVDHLAALRMDHPRVFEETHRLVFDWLGRGIIDGLRIDHPDGLYEPQEYLERLQLAAGSGERSQQKIYVIVEKILAAHERLPESWPVAGTTGYEFAALINAWLTCGEGERPLARLYRSFSHATQTFDEIVYESKKRAMQMMLAAEVAVLSTQLDRIAQASRYTADFTRYALRDAVIELIACFPVYRTYISARGFGPEDRRYVEWALNVARKRSRAADLSVFDFLGKVLLADTVHQAEGQRAALEFAMKLQQVSSAVTAKGVEDTAFYRYVPLVSLNEVGGNPNRFSLTTSGLHQANQERARLWPHSMLATSTHDTKRSEDVRARLAVLSEVPELWRQHLARWSRINRSRRRDVQGEAAPSRNEEYLVYQTLIGVWPAIEPDDAAREDLRKRVDAYVIKAAREAKEHTSWTNPDAQYEAALSAFVASLLDGSSQHNAFLRDFTSFVPKIAYFGMLNTLAQTALKLTAPGVPDVYQGMELPQLSLVDPDNRRPVHYEAHARALEELQALYAANPATVLREVLDDWQRGRAKLLLTWRLLQLRSQAATLWSEGDYEPIDVSGARADHIHVSARICGADIVIVIVPRWFAKLTDTNTIAPLNEVWADTRIELPAKWRNVVWREELSDAQLTAEGDAFRVASVLTVFPVAVIVGRVVND
jgi:(1->4)-alpha-D-glucan 1-alpha-D-glucosylmutase